MKKMLLIMSMMLIGCARAGFQPLDYQCKIVDDAIVCPDGSSMPLPKNGIDGIDGSDGLDGSDGKDGIDGVNGNDGADGVDGIDGIDGVDGNNGVPGFVSGYARICQSSDTGNVLLLVLSTGDVMAWSNGLGFVILEENVVHKIKSCKFMIVDGAVVLL